MIQRANMMRDDGGPERVSARIAPAARAVNQKGKVLPGKSRMGVPHSNTTTIHLSQNKVWVMGLARQLRS